MKINLWNASLVPGEEERKGGQGFWDRSVTGAAKKKPRAGGLGTRAGENLPPSQRRNAPMAALGTVQVNFPAAWRTQTSLKWCKARRALTQPADPVWPFPWRDAAILKEDSCHCSPAEEEWQILWAGPGREVQQESYTSSGSQVKTTKVQAVKQPLAFFPNTSL